MLALAELPQKFFYSQLDKLRKRKLNDRRKIIVCAFSLTFAGIIFALIGAMANRSKTKKRLLPSYSANAFRYDNILTISYFKQTIALNQMALVFLFNFLHNSTVIINIYGFFYHCVNLRNYDFFKHLKRSKK